MAVRNALVIGGGIGGLAAAAALGQRGIEVDLVEIRESASVLGVGINQPGNSLRALRDLGVLDEVLAAGFAFDGNDYRDFADERIVLVPSSLGADGVPANCGISRKALHEILLRAAERAGTAITYGTEVERYEDSADGVEVVLSNGVEKSYDLVVAFDGVRSPMRRSLLGIEDKPRYSGSAVWRKQLRRPAEVTRTTLWNGIGVKGGVIPLSDEHMYVLLVTIEPTEARYAEEELAELLGARLEGFEGMLADIRAQLRDDPDGIVYSPLVEMHVEGPWHKGRVIVLGDAVHAAVPHLTQGAAMAIEDAVVLADEVSRERDVEASLQAVEELRRPRTDLIFHASHAILEQEQSITAETLPYAIEGMREHLAEQTAHVESILNQPYRGA